MEINNQFWLNKWQKADVGFHEQEVNADLIAYFDTLNLKEGDCVLVPLCGKSRDMQWLASQRINVVGVELSSIACQEFFEELNAIPQISAHKTFIKYQHKNIQILCGDIFNLTPFDLPVVDAVYDWKALIALPNEMRKLYAETLTRCMSRNAYILLLTRESPCEVKPPPFPVSFDEIKQIYENDFSVNLLLNEPVTEINERMLKKGYKEMIKGIYLLKKRDK